MNPALAACSAPTRSPATMPVLQDASSHPPAVFVGARSNFFAACSKSWTLSRLAGASALIRSRSAVLVTGCGDPNRFPHALACLFLAQKRTEDAASRQDLGVSTG